MHEPSWRKPTGIFGIMGWILLWTILIVSFSNEVSRWPVLVQAAFYLVTGIVWILPLGPALKWMETGRWR